MHFNGLGLAVLGFILSGIQHAAAKSSDKGIEFVKACDSSADDVTNQCINRIPDDVGSSTGNHACAYHEAEVKCLGLCGNTVTWKVAYQNSLKRYRLVCAGYIDERIAEKEEEGEAEDDAPKKKNNKKSSEVEPEPEPEADTADEDQESKQAKKTSEEESTSKPSKTVQQKPTQKTSQSSSKSPMSSTKLSNSSASKSESQSKPTDKPQPPKRKSSSDDAANEDGSPASSGSDPNEKNPKDKSHAILPTMDPELADSSDRTRAVVLMSWLLVLISTTAIAL
ncbi:hypothetical protein COEREDRAFT_15650 [Coemansia reversa NRRL 1564]|uniref:Uncharacterized protein n=1 Tax=Coemansia reversa (strain ATCC 12441 / NRRL 1564) TaxID=763665 RepID=A0A2G5BAQ2_COERN|nr:hypothetical protein COEREDRAFT_15650 [Coemansia reversa NRRL 1564]|eukprot:PIA16072.1 hypothetical protein COEREDRAFT_15650 [Coemansia reversa NRRL 1564]